MDKYLKRLCKAILADRFNEKNYRTGKRYYGRRIITNPMFSSYGTIGFSASVYDERDICYCDLQYDWELNELLIDEMDYRDYFNLRYLDECGISKMDGEDGLSCYTPNGDEEMFIRLEKPRKEYLQEYIDNFDINYNVMMWWPNGQKGSGVPFDNIKEHYEDYEEWLQWLQKVCDGMPY